MKKIRKIVIITIAMLIGLQSGAVIAKNSNVFNNEMEVKEIVQPRVRAEITGNGVRIRKTASTNGTVLGLLYKGNEVNVIRLISNSQGKWAYVETSKGIIGYVSAEYIAL